MYHPRVAPIRTIIRGSSFIKRGINVVVWEIGLIQVRAAPLIMAKEDKLIMGLMMGSSSFKEIRGAQLEEDHKVTIEKRIE